jgi:hypothetical protein
MTEQDMMNQRMNQIVQERLDRRAHTAQQRADILRMTYQQAVIGVQLATSRAEKHKLAFDAAQHAAESAKAKADEYRVAHPENNA